MPRMRDAIRSGWNTSSASRRSPVETNMIGRPVTSRTDSAAPAARVAVELGQDDPVERDPLLERGRDVGRLLAGHRVEDEQRRGR